MFTFRGLTLIVLGEKTLAPFPDSFRSLSSASWFDWFNAEDYNLFTMVVGGIDSFLFIVNYLQCF